jgi:hypothetical protein
LAWDHLLRGLREVDHPPQLLPEGGSVHILHLQTPNCLPNPLDLPSPFLPHPLLFLSQLTHSPGLSQHCLSDPLGFLCFLPLPLGHCSLGRKTIAPEECLILLLFSFLPQFLFPIRIHPICPQRRLVCLPLFWAPILHLLLRVDGVRIGGGPVIRMSRGIRLLPLLLSCTILGSSLLLLVARGGAS